MPGHQSSYVDCLVQCVWFSRVYRSLYCFSGYLGNLSDIIVASSMSEPSKCISRQSAISWRDGSGDNKFIPFANLKFLDRGALVFLEFLEKVSRNF